MKHYRFTIIVTLALSLTAAVQAQSKSNPLTIKTRIDSVYVFGFDLTESRNAKGGIWNQTTGQPVTPQNYSEAKTDTINGQPVVRLYREVVRGNHPLNGWEIWMRCNETWAQCDDKIQEEKK